MTEPHNTGTRPPKVAEVVARRIVAYISDNGIQPGGTLPQEMEMQALFGVGRSTLREGARLLETQGVLSLRAGRGPIVQRPSPEHLLNSMTLMLHFRGATLETLFRTRVLFEPVVAAEAARNISEAQIAELRANIDGARSEPSTFNQLVRRELDFHTLIATGSGNIFAEIVVATLAAALSSEVLQVVQQHDVGQDLDVHEAIVEALAARDEVTAERLIREHVVEIVTYARTTFPELLKRPVHWM